MYYFSTKIKRQKHMKNSSKPLCVVGATGGIGSAVARLFKEEGYNPIILMDLPSKPLNEIADEISAFSINIDLRNQQSVKEAFDEAKKHSEKIHSLLLVSGVIENSNLNKMTLDLWNETISTNLSGFFYAHSKLSIGSKIMVE